MKINKIRILLIFLISVVFVRIIDYFDISNYVDCLTHLDNTIANSITFISILIGFISATYIMLQQDHESQIVALLRERNLLEDFNNSFKMLIDIGFVNVFSLILMNFLASNFFLLKIISYIALPLTIVFYISSFDIINTICKIILSEEKLKRKVKKVQDDDIKI